VTFVNGPFGLPTLTPLELAIFVPSIVCPAHPEQRPLEVMLIHVEAPLFIISATRSLATRLRISYA